MRRVYTACVSSFTVYTDGSGTTKGPGGIAYVALNADGIFVQEESLPLKECTNQKAEILAAAYALHRLPEGSTVKVISDSEYLVKGFHEWLPHWLKNNWRKRTGGTAKNQAHWQRLHDAAQRHESVSFEWCEGHAGIEWNERCDVLAGAARAEAKAQLAA